MYALPPTTIYRVAENLQAKWADSVKAAADELLSGNAVLFTDVYGNASLVGSYTGNVVHNDGRLGTRPVCIAEPNTLLRVRKSAADGLLKWPATIQRTLTNSLGGSGPASAIAAAALTGGLGYGVGKLYDWTLRDTLEKRFPRLKSDKLSALNAAKLGALLGGGLEAWRQSAYWRTSGGIDNPFNQILPVNGLQGDETKIASDTTGAYFSAHVPVNAFNQSVWSEVNSGTDPRYAQAVTNATAIAGTMTNRDKVSIFDIAKGAVIGGLTGAFGSFVGEQSAAAAAAGIGLLAPLSPDQVAKLKQTGAYGGAITAIGKTLLGEQR